MTNQTCAAPERVRIDKWLWFARMARTRAAAARLVADGYVRINGERALRPGKMLKAGDIVTLALAHDTRVLRVIAPGVRRSDAQAASLLYENLQGGGDWPQAEQ
ncbi:MAG: RNA-binding S4 domain-containing protein [Hyphomicrobiales bacterium]|nr:RNA-binding S4 domain-containing protein [Hyphomicrobiales bacterium]